MALKKDRIEVYQSRRNKEYGWRYITKNGKRVAVAGETYKNSAHAWKMADTLFAKQIADGTAELGWAKSSKAKKA